MNKATNHIEQYIQQHNMELPWIFTSIFFKLYNHLTKALIIYLMCTAPIVCAIFKAVEHFSGQSILGLAPIVFSPALIISLYMAPVALLILFGILMHLIISRNFNQLDNSMSREHKYGMAKVLRDNYINEYSGFFSTSGDKTKKQLASEVTPISIGLISESTERRLAALRSIIPPNNCELNDVLALHVRTCSFALRDAMEKEQGERDLERLNAL